MFPEWNGGLFHSSPVSPRFLLLADTVETVEKRAAPKISRKSVFGCLRRCKALWTDTRVYDRFCGNRCGPSHCRARDAPAALKNFVRHPEKTFSTVSTQSGHRSVSQAFAALPRMYEAMQLFAAPQFT